MQDWKNHLEAVIDKILVDEQHIDHRLDELARQINNDYRAMGADSLLAIGTLRGSVFFFCDLVRRLQMPVTIDFLSARSYGGTESSGVVQITSDITQEIRGRHVLIIEDIVDTGYTMSKILPVLQERQPASLRLCTLLSKPSRRVVPVHIDYQGFEIENDFVVGYGLDYDEKYRHLPMIAVLKPECYK